MLQNIWFRLAAIAATVHVCSHILPPNLKAIGRSAETAGLLVRSKQFEKLRNERWCGAKFRISDKKISVSSALWFYFALRKAHLGFARLFAGCTDSKKACGKKGFDVFGKQIAALKDLQFLLACCKQPCLKKNKHLKVDGGVGKPWSTVVKSLVWGHQKWQCHEKTFSLSFRIKKNKLFMVYQPCGGNTWV